MTARCKHANIRFQPTERGSIACHDCGRLFGHLDQDSGRFVAFNPSRTR